ncbi:predicted protein, partial [Arabidopsis lyrata subsp. lyrata]
WISPKRCLSYFFSLFFLSNHRFIVLIALLVLELSKIGKKCFSPAPCQKAGTQGCMEFCRNISFLLFGECTTNSDQCCCVTKTK